MMAWHTLGLLEELVVFALLFAGAGATLLRLLKILDCSALDRFLYSLTAGIILLELAVSAGEFAPRVRTGVLAAVAVIAVLGIAGLPMVFTDLRHLTKRFFALPGISRFLAAVLLFVLLLQGMATFAPLTGSDAMHYHFAAQQMYLREGFHAPWSLLHGFFCGLGHQLILAGLALGSGQLAQLWLYLGGVVAAFATLRVAQLWVSGIWPWLAALAFALTPVAFWQTSIAGAPDIWMCAFVPLCLLAILRARATAHAGEVILAGIFAGATAGTKYTGLFLAGALLLAFFVAIRSLRKGALFFLTAAATGCWMYVRNWIWTGDPVFPFLFARLHHAGNAANETAIRAILLDTGAVHAFSVWSILKFSLFAAVDQTHMGAWQLLGPLVLIFGPFAMVQLRKNVDGQAALAVWIAGALGIGLTSAMLRFLLPLLPVALGASIAGVALATKDRWRVLRALALLSLGSFMLAGLAALLLYARPALAVATGRDTQENYLSTNAPDYQRSQFLNRELERLGQFDSGLVSANSGRALIFINHLYYVRVPYYNGDPEDSWEMNPAALRNDADWLRLFDKHQIRWVLKSPDYPTPLSDSLQRLEQEGVLQVCSTAEVESFAGNRIEGIRVREPITLLCLHNAPPSN
jgi:hypothetical protein